VSVIRSIYSTVTDIHVSSVNESRALHIASSALHADLQRAKQCLSALDLEFDQILPDDDSISDDSSCLEDSNLEESLTFRLKLLMALVPSIERICGYIYENRYLEESSQQVVEEMDLESKQKANQHLEVLQEVAPPSYESSLYKESHDDLEKVVSTVSLRFRNLMIKLSSTPLQYENPGLLDLALTYVPIERIYDLATDEHSTLLAMAASQGEQFPFWNYQDCVIRSLLRYTYDISYWLSICPSG
jgi:hypothetical protein